MLDRFWGDRQIRSFETSVYAMEIVDETPARAAVVLTGEANGLRVRKTLSLQRGVSSVDVGYEITNQGDADYTGRFWIANALFPGDAESVRIFYPFGGLTSEYRDLRGAPGVPILSYTPGQKPAEGNNFVNDPANAWAAVSSSAGLGGGFDIPYAFLERFYSYLPQPGGGTPVPTVEWWTRPLLLRPIARGRAEAAQHPELEDPLAGYVFHTQWRLIPFAEFPTVSGVKQGFVAAITATEEGSVDVKVLADRPRECHLRVTRSLLGGSNETLDNREIQFEADTPVRFELKSAMPTDGTYVFAVTATPAGAAGDGIRVEQVLVRGEPSGSYTPPPEGPKDTRFDPVLEPAPLGNEFRTPCVPWASPQPVKPRLLMLTPTASHQETGELMRRIDADLTLVETARTHIFRSSDPSYASWTPPDPEALLRKALRERFDAILIGGSLYWETIPEDLRGTILEQVQQGTGLVYVNPMRVTGRLKEILEQPAQSLPPEVIEGIPIELVPGLERFSPPAEVGRVYACGEGRIIVLRYSTVPNGKVWRESRTVTPAIPDDGLTDFPYWEICFALAAKCLRFAAATEPEIRISGVEWHGETATLNLLSHGTDSPVLITGLCIGPHGKRVALTPRNAEPGTGAQRISIPVPGGAGLNGPHLLCLILRTTQGQALDWYAASRISDAGVGLNAVKAAEGSTPGTLEGEIDIRTEPDRQLPIQISCRVRDAWGRLLADETLQGEPGTPGPMPFRLRLQRPAQSALCTLDIRLLAGNAAVDRQTVYVPVRIPPGNDITFTVWGMAEANHWLKRTVATRMRDIGFDIDTGLHVGALGDHELPGAARAVMAAGLQFSPMGIHRLASSAAALKSTVRKPCLSASDTRAEMRDDVHRYVSRSQPFHPPFYFVADENSLGHYSSAHDFCQSDDCLAAFRAALRREYGLLDRLNATWQRDFESWDSVVPDTFSQASERSCFSAWMDHRRFMFGVFADAFALERACLQEVDPDGRLAVSGMGMPSVHNGFDWYALSRNLDHVVAYLRPFVTDAMRSFRRPSSTLSAWNGYGSTYADLRYRIWHQLLNGFQHPSYWHHRYMIGHGDESISQAGLDFQAIITETRASGIGRLLQAAQWEDSPIGLHYSVASLIAAHATGVQTVIGDPLFEANLNGWSECIRDLGFQPPRCISTAELEAGALRASETPLFVLPLSQAMTEREVQALEAYVDSGGIVIADACAGIWDEHAMQRTDGGLARLFGVRYGQAPAARPAANLVLGDGDDALTTPLRPVAGDLILEGASALAGAAGLPATRTVDFGGLHIQSEPQGSRIPAALVKTRGHGAAIYLNTALDTYGPLRRQGIQVEPVLTMLRRALETAGFNQTKDALLPPGTEAVRYRHGPNRYIGLCRTPAAAAEPAACRMQIHAPQWQYVLGTAQDTPEPVKGSVIDTALAPGQTRIVALLPARPDEPAIHASWADGAISVQAEQVLEDGRPAWGALRLILSDPTGRERKAYTQTLVINT
jgi:hypothetical protein